MQRLCALRRRGGCIRINNRTAMRLFKEWVWVSTDLPAIANTFLV
jgi:hypothetical protein